MTRQIVPTHVLQAIVNYLEAKPFSEVNHLLKALIETAKPEPAALEEEPTHQMKDPFFISEENTIDQETK